MLPSVIGGPWGCLGLEAIARCTSTLAQGADRSRILCARHSNRFYVPLVQFPIGDPDPTAIINAAGFSKVETASLLGGLAEKLFL
jgi:hypothetical protein